MTWKCLVAIATVLPGTVAPHVYAQDGSKGAALMAAGRQAIGGENRLAAAKTLQVTGTFRRVTANNDVDGDFEVFVELPDKYLRSEKTGTPGQPSTETIEAIVGTEIRDVVRGGGGRGGRGGGGGGDDSGQPADDDLDRGVDPDTQRRARQAEVGRLLLMWLLRTEVPVTWIGIAESPDGKADVLEARLAGEPTRLFLDAASHMPLMMTWQAVPGRAGGRSGRRGAAQGGPPQPVAFEMTFADHRAIDGIRLPHLVTRGINGQTVEQWTIKSYRVNPSLNADTFTR